MGSITAMTEEKAGRTKAYVILENGLMLEGWQETAETTEFAE